MDKNKAKAAIEAILFTMGVFTPKIPEAIYNAPNVL